MIERYVGACNIQTVIKEACFFGIGGGYIAAGSDDGRYALKEGNTIEYGRNCDFWRQGRRRGVLYPLYFCEDIPSLFSNSLSP